ncbi:MAG: GMC family oxidoreductase [Pseudonocardiaceae bacterium]
MTSADYVIVGAGPAGCVLADRLSADEHTQVALVEAGDQDPNSIPEIRVPGLLTRTFGSEADWGFKTIPQAGLNGRSIFYPTGKILGGSTSINVQLWTLGHRADYDGWAAAGCVGWGYADVLPYFEKIEAERIRLAGIRYPSPVTPDFVTACARTGHAPSGAQQEGYTLARVTHRDGLRWSSVDSYLRPAQNRPNLSVLTGRTVRRVLFDGTHAVGVELETDYGVQQIRADREVIVAAGAIGSPYLLMLSGIGPGDHLAEHGIQVLVDAPGVGQDLSDHLLVPLTFAGRGFESPGVGAGPEEIQRYLEDRTGPLNSNLAEALLFLRTQDELDGPDVEIAMVVIPYGEHATSAQHGLALAVILLRPESRGSVTLRTADPHDPPLLDLGFLSDAHGADLATTVAGVRKAQDILNQPVLSKWLGEPLTPGALSSDTADIVTYIRRTGLGAFHPVSTCRMGPDPQSVVDLGFQVRGTSGLRVVDAATMPSQLRGHLHATITMLAERASELIIKQY